MYTNPFIYKRPLYAGQDDLITINRRQLMEKVVSGLEFGHWLTVSGGKKAGKSTFLLRLIEECKTKLPEHQFILINLDEMQTGNLRTLYEFLARRVVEIFPQGPVASLPPQSDHGEIEPLEQLFHNVAQVLENTHGRLVLLMDGLESMQKAASQELLHGLMNLHNTEATVPALSRIQVIVAGTLTQGDLQMENGRAFSEHAMKVLIDDFRYDEIDAMLQRVSRELDITCQSGFVRLLYDATAGTAYLVQKICYRILETAYAGDTRSEFSLKNAEEAISSIIREGETNVEMVIRQIEKDNQLVEMLVRTMRERTLKSSTFDPQLNTLASIGALSERQGIYRVRNLIYESIFRDYFTAERLANHYFAQNNYHRAKELFFEAVTEQAEAKSALDLLLMHSKTIGEKMKEETSARGILQAFMNLVSGVQNCSLMLLDKDRTRLRIVEAIGLPAEEYAAYALRKGEGVAGWVALTGRTQVVRDVTDEVECPAFVDRDLAVKLNIGAMIALPLHISGKVGGVINLCLRKPHAFTTSEVKALEIFAAHASIALQNLPLYHSIERHHDHLEIIRELLLENDGHMDAEGIYDKIVAAAARVTGCEKSYLIHKDVSTGSWHFTFPRTVDVTTIKLPDQRTGFAMPGYTHATTISMKQQDPLQEIHEAQAEWVLPFIIDGDVNGCLVISNDTPVVFSKAQQQLIAILGEIACMTIKNNRLYHIADKKTQQVITSKGIGEAISHEKSLPEILNLVAQECLNVVGYPNKIVLVLLKDNERGKLIVRAASGDAFANTYLGKSFPLQEKSVVAWALQQGAPRIVQDTALDSQYSGIYPGIRSEIAVPLSFRDEVIGVIDIQSTKPEDFDLLDQEALIGVAHSAAIGTKIAELCDVRIKELEALYRIGTKISSSLNITEVLQAVCREGFETIGNGNRSLTVQFIDQENLIPSIKITNGVSSLRTRNNASAFWQKSRESWVAENKCHYLNPDISTDPLYEPSAQSARSAMIVPIIFDHRVVGLITFESALEDDFGEVELRFMKGLANQAGVAIENARLGEDLAKAQVGLSKSLETAAVEATVSGLSHDIKNISSMIAGETQWLDKCSKENHLSPNEVTRATKEINKYVKKIEDLTNSLKNRADNLPPQFTTFKLREAMQEAILLIAAKARRQQVELQKNDRLLNNIWLSADQGRLLRAFFNILTNALDAMPDGGTIRIDAQQIDKQVLITISDTGQGIPEEHLNEVLQPFYTTKKHGYGLGLAITKRIVETDHGGRLILHSIEGRGTTVEIFLPMNGDAARNKTTAASTAAAPPASRRSEQAHNNTKHLLVVNDDKQMLTKLERFLRRGGFKVTPSVTGKRAVEHSREKAFDAIILDYHLKKDHSPTQSAIDFVPELKKNAPTTPIILTSASMDRFDNPEIYCDYFLEINQTFWQNILELVNNCLTTNRQSATALL